MDKVEKKPVIRVRTIRGGVYAHNFKACLIARTKGEAIKILKEAYPGDYEIQDVSLERQDKGPIETSNETSGSSVGEN